MFSPHCVGIPIAFQFSQAAYTVTRGQAAELVITASSLLTFNASVILAVTGGNATAGKYCKCTAEWIEQYVHCMTLYLMHLGKCLIESCYLYVFASATYIYDFVKRLDHLLSKCFLCMTAGEDYTAANPLVVPLELCGNRTLIQIPTISDFELLELSTEYFTVQVVEIDGGLETITTSVTVVIVEPTGGREYTYIVRSHICTTCVAKQVTLNALLLGH